MSPLCGIRSAVVGGSALERCDRTAGAPPESEAEQCLHALDHNHPRVCGGGEGGPGWTASRNRRKAHTTSRDVSSPGGSAAAGTGSARSEESVRTKPRRRGRGVGHVSHQCSPLVSRDGGHSRSTRQLCGRGWPKPWARAEAVFFSRWSEGLGKERCRLGDGAVPSAGKP